jgi:tetratricopeptide (TPR) repeat protein
MTGRGAGAAAINLCSVTLAFVLAALAVGVDFFAVSRPVWRLWVTSWRDAHVPTADSTFALESLAICTSMGQMGLEADWGQLDPDFAAGKKALAAQDWNEAIAALKLASLRDPQNADIENYVGYAYYRLRQMGPAMHYYQKALRHNHRHRGVHEHLGELYLALGEAAKAERQLAILAEICLIPCEEYGNLERVIAIYKKQLTR